MAIASGKIPATVVTGFLGAGKTSLIRHLVAHSQGRRLALVINEFGELGVDRELLLGCGIAGCGEEDVVELANGCLCCTVADDFLPTMRKLLAKDPPPEHIVIETSGLALPKPLLQAFSWPEVRNRLTVDGVVAVVDAEAVAEGRFAPDPAAVAAAQAADPALEHDSPLDELLEEQLAAADMVLLNKLDRVDAAGLFRAEARIAAGLRPAVRVLRTSHGAVDPLVLLGLGAAAEDDLAARPSHIDTAAAHDHDDFTAFTLALATIATPEALLARIRAAALAHDILRVKGFVAVEEKPMRLAVQAVGGRAEAHYDRPWRRGEAQGRLVVIGLKGLDRAAVAAALAG
jgi:cobalamin biosynthesis protein CobW